MTQRLRRAKQKENRQKKRVLEDILSDDKATEEMRQFGDRLKEHPDISYSDKVFRLGLGMQKMLQEKLHTTGNSIMTSALVAEVSKQGALSKQDLGALLKVPAKRINNIINRSSEKYQELVNISRLSPETSSESRKLPEERKLIRDYVRSYCLEGVSGTEQLHCTMTKEELYDTYIIHGAPIVYWSLLALPKFQKLAESYDPTDKDPKKPSGTLAQYLYYTQQWADAGFDTPRPDGIWARSKRTFWKIVKEREKGKKNQILNIRYSKKVHPCSVCGGFETTIRQYNLLTSLRNDAKTGHDRQSLERRIAPLVSRFQAYKDHLEKYLTQRRELQKLRAQLPSLPGVAIVYEDFCSRYQADGRKMANLILTLIYWDHRQGKEVIEYHDTFSLGSQPINFLGDPKKRGKQDKYLYRDVWLNHFRKGTFKPFHTIVKTGDNGSSLKSYDTFWLHSQLWELQQTRILWCTLCPHHAYNVCDAHGSRANNHLEAVERLLDGALGTPQEHARAINEKKIKNTAEACWVVSTQAPDDLYMPPGKHDSDRDVFRLNSVCVAFPEVPDIHDESKNPQRSIRWPGLGMVTTTLGGSDGVGFVDLRKSKGKISKVCPDCTARFGRDVLEEEHDQTKHYLCPRTKIYSQEPNLSRPCSFCENQPVGTVHTQGTNTHCPSKGQKADIYPHRTFNAFSMYQTHMKLRIRYEKRNKLSDQEIAELCQKFRTVMELKAHPLEKKTIVPLKEKMFVVWKSHPNTSTLPWTLGQCQLVDNESQKYTMRIYAPAGLKNYALWDSQFKDTREDRLIDFGTELYYPVKMTRMKISTEDIVAIAFSGQYGWSRESLLQTPDCKSMNEKLVEESENRLEKSIPRLMISEINETNEDITLWEMYYNRDKSTKKTKRN